MSKFKVGDRLKSRDGATGTCVSIGPRTPYHPADAVWWQHDKFPLGDETYSTPDYFELLAPTPCTIVDVTRRTVTKTVEEEVVEYPDLPNGTIVYVGGTAVFIKDYGDHWLRTGYEGRYRTDEIQWPATVLRYGDGK